MKVNAGLYLRKNFPELYSHLVGMINSMRKLFTPFSIYITDSLGGSFKTYLQLEDINDKISLLCQNLDPDSIKTVEIILQRIKYFPDENDKHRISRNLVPPGGLLPIESDAVKRIIKKELENWKNKLRFMSDHIEESVFYYYHGLNYLPQSVSVYIRDSDFIDIGSFIGDSAIALTEYGYRKIFSIEMSPKSIEKYKENLQLFGLASDRYQIINAAIGATDNEQPVTLFDTGSSGLSVFRRKGKYDQFNVQMRTIDSLCSEYDIKPKFIKVDIEGAGVEFVNGARGTLTEFRPVLSIAIYHNPYEFFEIKPLLESMLADYTFLIRKLSSGLENNLCHSEIILLGYPKDLLIQDISITQ